jgi:hypothetical protein
MVRNAYLEQMAQDSLAASMEVSLQFGCNGVIHHNYIPQVEAQNGMAA